MLFLDGLRIDLAFDPLVGLATVAEDTLAVVLLDKDGRIGDLPPSSDAGYVVQKPTRKEFDETINEIFWCSNNVAKGIWRDELTYVKFMYEFISLVISSSRQATACDLRSQTPMPFTRINASQPINRTGMITNCTGIMRVMIKWLNYIQFSP